MGQVHALHAVRVPGFPAAAEAFVRAHIDARSWSPATAVKYRQTLAAMAGQLAGSDVGHDLAVLDGPAGAHQMAEAFAAAFATSAPATLARHRSTLRSAVSWWQECGWIRTDPMAGWATPRVVVDDTRALSRAQVAALFALAAPIREKTLWRMLYESAARAGEILNLDVADLDTAGRRARVVGKGGATEWVFWQTGTARLLPRLLAGRATGPVFLANRSPTRAVAATDTCPVTGRARLSYRRAAELFATATTSLANPDGGGWTLHQLRHSALTHAAEDGTNTPMLLARSRHASVRSLELRPPGPRRRGGTSGRHRPRRTPPPLTRHARHSGRWRRRHPHGPWCQDLVGPQNPTRTPSVPR